MPRSRALKMASAFGTRYLIGLVNGRIWLGNVSASLAAAPEGTGRQKLPIPIAIGFAPRSIMVARPITLLLKNGLSKRNAANIHSSWPRLSRVLSAEPEQKTGSSTVRDFRCSIKAFYTTLCAFAMCQRHQGQRFPDCRYVSPPGTWRSQDRSFLSRRPHGRERGAADHYIVVERKPKVSSSLRGTGVLLDFPAG